MKRRVGVAERTVFYSGLSGVGIYMRDMNAVAVDFNLGDAVAVVTSNALALGVGCGRQSGRNASRGRGAFQRYQKVYLVF